jgi:Ankyrin repeat
LISRGVEINLPASSGSTALHFAATNNRKGIIEVLLLSGADPSIPNESGHLASELTSDKDIKTFLSRDPSHAMTTRSSRYALSAINQARQSLKAHVENYQNNDQSDASNIGLEKLTISDQPYTANSEKASAPVEAASPRKQNLHLQSVPNVDLGSSSKNVLNFSNKSCEYVENDSDEAEEREGLKQAVFKAATDTADATQNIEGASARRSVAEICQSTRYFARNEPTLRKVNNNSSFHLTLFHLISFVFSSFYFISVYFMIFHATSTSFVIEYMTGRLFIYESHEIFSIVIVTTPCFCFQQ